MKFYYDLYLDNDISLKKEEVIKNLEQDKWQLEVYVISFSRSKNNQLDIYNSALLLQKAVSKNEVFVVGIASGYLEALELVEKITKEVYDNTKSTEIKNYLIEKQQMFEESNQ